MGEMCSEESDEWDEKLQLNGEETVFKLDCSATVTAKCYVCMCLSGLCAVFPSPQVCVSLS